MLSILRKNHRLFAFNDNRFWISKIELKNANYNLPASKPFSYLALKNKNELKPIEAKLENWKSTSDSSACDL